jgi:hypothetical protein
VLVDEWSRSMRDSPFMPGHRAVEGLSLDQR